MTTARKVSEALRRDYIRKPDMPSGLFLEEVGSPDGARRADALWIPNHGKGIIGHEVKVTRSDLMSELLDPLKAESWKRYCRHWWLVVGDESILAGLEIPEDWGIKTPPTQANRRQFKVIRTAPALVCAPLEPAIHRLATVVAHERARRVWTDSQHKHEVARLKADVEKAKSGVLQRDPMSNALAEVVVALRNSGHYISPNAEEMTEAIVNAHELKQARQRVDALVRERLRRLNQVCESLSDSWEVKELQKLLREDVFT